MGMDKLKESRLGEALPGGPPFRRLMLSYYLNAFHGVQQCVTLSENEGISIYRRVELTDRLSVEFLAGAAAW